MQKYFVDNNHSCDNLHEISTFAEVRSFQKLPDGTLQTEFAGLHLGQLSELVKAGDYNVAWIETFQSAENYSSRIAPPI